MEFITTIELNGNQLAQLLQLWNSEYPVRLGYKNQGDFEKYLNGLSEKHHVLLVDGEVIYGWYFDFIREGESWFALVLHSSIHGKGCGSKLLNHAKSRREELNGWVIDHTNEMKLDDDLYKSPLEFYVKNGFNVLLNKRLETDRISAVKINWVK